MALGQAFSFYSRAISMRLQSLVLVVFLLLGAIAQAAFWWGLGRPVEIAESWQGKFASVSFAPYRQGQSPLTKDYPPPEQIAEDLAVAAGIAQGIRTYTSQEGMELVPELARRHDGLNVIQSAWLGVDKPVNDKEVAALIALARSHPDTVKRVIVGNEVLLRRDLSPQQLIAYIREVKAAVDQPVSYADVWAFWLKYPEVAAEVDFLTIHILPYWEDEPESVAESEAYIIETVAKIRAAFPGKPILIGESGWPSDGRNRGPAIADREHAARYVRMLARVAAENDLDYNVVEAFDQNWKSHLEGTVGARWGVLDNDRQVKFALSGPIDPLPDWQERAVAAIALGSLLGLVFGFRAARARGGAGLAVMGLVLLGHILAAMVIHAGFVTFSRSFSSWALGWSAAKLAVIVAFSWAVMKAAQGQEQGFWGARLPLIATAAALTWAGLLAFDGRYRDIPVAEFLVPVFGPLLLALPRRSLALSALMGNRPLMAFWARGLGFALIAAAIAVVVGEGFAVVGEDFAINYPTFGDQWPPVAQAMVSNREILIFAAMLGLMAVPFLADAKPPSRRRR